MTTLTLTKHFHAAFTLTNEFTSVLVDPGKWGTPVSLEGIDALLVTHLHADHFDADLVRTALERDIEVYVPVDAVGHLGAVPASAESRLHTVTPGQRFTLGEIEVEAVVTDHARLAPGDPRIDNAAYLVNGSVLITGDAHPRPDASVSTLVTPMNAPWLSLPDLFDYLADVRPRRVVGVHDALLSDLGSMATDGIIRRGLGEDSGIEFVHPAIDETISLEV